MAAEGRNQSAAARRRVSRGLQGVAPSVAGALAVAQTATNAPPSGA